MTDETTGEWLSVRAAAARLNTSEQAIRSKVQRRTLRSRKGNSGAISVFIDEPVSVPVPETPINERPSSNIDRKMTDVLPVITTDESEQPVPAWVYRETMARHRAELDRLESSHRAEIERLERAHRLAADTLMRKVAGLLVERRRLGLIERLAMLWRSKP